MDNIWNALMCILLTVSVVTVISFLNLFSAPATDVERRSPPKPQNIRIAGAFFCRDTSSLTKLLPIIAIVQTGCTLYGEWGRARLVRSR